LAVGQGFVAAPVETGTTADMGREQARPAGGAPALTVEPDFGQARVDGNGSR